MDLKNIQRIFFIVATICFARKVEAGMDINIYINSADQLTAVKMTGIAGEWPIEDSEIRQFVSDFNAAKSAWKKSMRLASSDNSPPYIVDYWETYGFFIQGISYAVHHNISESQQVLISQSTCEMRRNMINCKLQPFNLTTKITQTIESPYDWYLGVEKIKYHLHYDSLGLRSNNFTINYENEESFGKSVMHTAERSFSSHSIKITNSGSKKSRGKVAAQMIGSKITKYLDIQYKASLGSEDDSEIILPYIHLCKIPEGDTCIAYFNETIVIENYFPDKIKIYDVESLKTIKVISL